MMILLLISSCASLNQKQKIEPVSDFCSRYNQVIQSKGDSDIKANILVKKRIAANEIDYKCNCLKLKEAYCALGIVK